MIDIQAVLNGQIDLDLYFKDNEVTENNVWQLLNGMYNNIINIGDSNYDSHFDVFLSNGFMQAVKNYNKNNDINNLVDKKGNTILMYVAKRRKLQESVSLVKFLINCGIDTRRKNLAGQDAYSVIRKDYRSHGLNGRIANILDPERWILDLCENNSVKYSLDNKDRITIHESLASVRFKSYGTTYRNGKIRFEVFPQNLKAVEGHLVITNKNISDISHLEMVETLFINSSTIPDLLISPKLVVKNQVLGLNSGAPTDITQLFLARQKELQKKKHENNIYTKDINFF